MWLRGTEQSEGRRDIEEKNNSLDERRNQIILMAISNVTIAGMGRITGKELC